MNYNISRIEKEKENTLRSLKDTQVQMFMEKNQKDFLNKAFSDLSPFLKVEETEEFLEEAKKHFTKEKEYREIFFNQSILRGYYADNGIIFALFQKIGDITLQAYFKKFKLQYADMLQHLKSLIGDSIHLMFLLDRIFLQCNSNIDYQLIILNHEQHMKEIEDLDFDELDDWEEDLIEYVKNDLKYNKDKYDMFSSYLKREHLNQGSIVKYLYNKCLSDIKQIEEYFYLLDEMYFEENKKYTKETSPNAYNEIVEFEKMYNESYPIVKEHFHKYKEIIDNLSEDGFSIAKDRYIDEDSWNGEYHLKISYNMETFEIEGMEFLDEL